MYSVTTIASGDVFDEYEGESYEDAKTAFEVAWERLSDHDRRRVEQMLFAEYEKSTDELVDEYGYLPDPKRIIAIRDENGVVKWL